ncbi:CocE/NonD family hydrolase [Streptomyces himalayensis]|uniref:CocE/NonD family hydrolase n=1 Tax=Streptomyces himalayensis TaxID=2820085 RepID=UPI00215DA8D8|nr:CocE/NonD family hydrolase [Streptomyces himalayensis]
MMAANLDPLAVAGRGFMVVIQDTRGRFASEREWEPWTYEEADGYDTVRWAAALPGPNGSVAGRGHGLPPARRPKPDPRWHRNLNTGEPEDSATTARVARQQVFHDPARPSRIVLPVVPA